MYSSMVLNDDQDASKLDFANLVCVMALGLTFPTKIAAFPFTRWKETFALFVKIRILI